MDDRDAPFPLDEAPARLAALRSTQGLTQAALAERLGVNQSAVARLEGSQRNVGLDTLARWAAALGQRPLLSFEPAADLSPITIGTSPTGTAVELSSEELAAHVVVTGSAGCGKSVTLAAICDELIDRGWSVTVLDQTPTGGDTELRRRVAAAAERNDAAFGECSTLRQTGSLAGAVSDPLVASAVGRAALGSSDGYWTARATTVLDALAELCAAVHRIDPQRFAPLDVTLLAELLTGSRPDELADRLAAAERDVDASVRERVGALADHGSDAAKIAWQMGDQLLAALHTDAGERILAASNAALEGSAVTYVGAESLTGAGPVVLAALLAPLCRPSATPRALVVTGAHHALGPETMGLLRRARAAGVAAVLEVQSLLDFDGVDGVGSDAVDSHVGAVLALHQGTDAAADAAAAAMRTHTVDPSVLRNLAIGDAVLSVREPTRYTAWFRVAAPDAAGSADWVLGGRYDIAVGSTTLQDRLLVGMRLDRDGGHVLELRTLDGITESVPAARARIIRSR